MSGMRVVNAASRPVNDRQLWAGSRLKFTPEEENISFDLAVGKTRKRNLLFGFLGQTHRLLAGEKLKTVNQFKPDETSLLYQGHIARQYSPSRVAQESFSCDYRHKRRQKGLKLLE
ncbi:MAG: hypothetical protein JJ868_19955 [Shimia sp.]|uniref:hypothetical protein n=1 Tax=Shimia sp. TaxID=1954381 RepID=UPI001B18F115|nr:hypothetical protein [Shimia sp.]MBO6899635.1 hypothetical protein [Shimia sp.]